MNSIDLIRSVIIDGLLGAVAGMGFAILSNPSRNAVLVSALLAAIGHAFRFYLINYLELDISTSSFIAAAAIGMLSTVFARIIRCPAEIFAFPSLLPMIPGMFAYRAILSLMKFMQNTNEHLNQVYIMDFFHNGMTATFILVGLVVGVSLPILLFPKHSYSVTRKYYQ